MANKVPLQVVGSEVTDGLCAVVYRWCEEERLATIRRDRLLMLDIFNETAQYRQLESRKSPTISDNATSERVWA